MIFDLGAAKTKTTLLDFNGYVLNERRMDTADILLMSFNTFVEIDLMEEDTDTNYSKIKKLAQLSLDDNCTIFCGIKTVIEGQKYLSVAAFHKGKLYDIADRTINLGRDGYSSGDKLKVYNSTYGKIAVLISTDASLDFLWKKLSFADFVFCFTEDDTLGCEITKLSIKNKIPAIILSPVSSMLVRG